MKYILIISYIYSSHGVSITNAEYNSKEACVKAGQEFNTAANGILSSVYYSCSPKG